MANDYTDNDYTDNDYTVEEKRAYILERIKNVDFCPPEYWNDCGTPNKSSKSNGPSKPMSYNEAFTVKTDWRARPSDFFGEMISKKESHINSKIPTW